MNRRYNTVYSRRKKNSKSKQSYSEMRVSSLILFTFVFLGIILFRLFDIQVMKHGYYSAIASGQHQIYEDIVPTRGSVYVEDRHSSDLYPVVVNKEMYIIYAVPKSIEDPRVVSRALASILEMDEREIEDKLSDPDDAYEVLKKRVPEDIKNQVIDRNLVGIGAAPDDIRYYTENEFASHITGFLGFEGDVRAGKYGIEGYYNDELGGQRGFLAAEKDALGRFVIGGDKLYEEARHGDDLVLTIDRVIQYKVENHLEEAVNEYGAENGTVIVMNPKNGEIIALANYPDFNPNAYNEVEDVGVFTNRAVYDLYEPGSAFKPIMMAAAINLGLVSPGTFIDDEGSIKVDKFTIKNSDLAANGSITMTNVLEKSSNVGMVKLGKMLGKERMYQYIERFGFTDLSGVDLDSEAQTHIPLPEKWTEADQATFSFGQGLAVTPLRLINGIAAIANGGKLVKPHVVKKVIHADGKEEVVDNTFQKEVISESTANTVAAMMVSVVENGTGKPARVPGYTIAGKTGTAQVAAKNARGYDPDQKITSFVGFGPVEDPEFVMLVKLNNPGGDVWGSTTAAPLFKKVAEDIITYYQIPPTDKVE